MGFTESTNRFGEPVYIDENGTSFDTRPDGTISFNMFSILRLGQQDQYSCRMIDGWDGSPVLGLGLEFTDGHGGPGDTANYHALGIPAHNAQRFIDRIRAYRVVSWGITEQQGQSREATDDEIAAAAAYLEAEGIQITA